MKVLKHKKRFALILVSILVVSGAVGGVLAYYQSHNEVIQPVKSFEAPKKEPEKPKVTISAKGIIALVNDYRVKNGLQPLKEVPELDKSAMDKCLDMQKNDYFAHTNPVTGISGGDMAKATYPNASFWGENLVGTTIPTNEDVVTRWINSPGHRENILGAYTVTGVAVCSDDPHWTRPTDLRFATQHFAN
jgi:uncharacterized protein YkwD